MMLSPYHNPPYKLPTRVESAATPPRSPKRKRTAANVDGISTPPPRSQIDDAGLDPDAVLQGSGADSPRTKVAQQFRDLDLRPTIAKQQQQDRRAGLRMTSPSTSPPPLPLTPRKRRRVPDASIVSGNDVAEGKLGARDDSGSDSSDEDSEGDQGPTIPKGKTTDCPSQPRPPSRMHFNGCAVTRTKPLPPVPAPSSSAATLQVLNPSTPPQQLARPHSPLPIRDELTPDQAALTWQEDEITGHEIAPGGEDDGEGINGIGFRPTPAIAYARKVQRLRQISEWRAREAREARIARAERRRGDVGRKVEEERGRSVRFRMGLR